MAKKNVSEAQVIKATVTEASTPTHPKQKEINQIISDDKMSKSQKIRALHVIYGGDNKARSMVAKDLKIRYQHVRNVLITPLKKG